MDQTIINQMILLFGLIIVGYITNKMGGLDDVANKRFSSFLLKVTLPATILDSALSQNGMGYQKLISIVVVGVIVFTLIPLVAKLYAKLVKGNAIHELMIIYPNQGFMGLPIVASIFGAEGVFYVAILMMIFNIHIFTYGVILLQGKGENLRSLLRKLCTPGIIAAIIAFLVVLFPVSVPTQLHTLIGSVGSITTPLAMIVIGSQLAEVSFVEALKNKKLYSTAFVKLVVNPVVVFAVLSLIFGPVMQVKVAALLSGLPTAGNVTMLCSEYDGDAYLSAQGTCISTLLSILTIPVLIALL